MRVESFSATEGGTSQTVSASTTSAATATALTKPRVRIISTVDVFFRRGANPTAVANTDDIIPAFQMWRIDGIQQQDKLAFITASGTGTVYIAQED